MATDRAGFTLLELLVALAIASVVLLTITGTLFSLNRAHDQVGDRMQQQRALRNSLDLLRRELSSMLYRADDKQLRLQVQDRDFYGKPASILSLATLAPPLDGEATDQLLVRYQPEEQGQQIRLTRASHDYFLQDSVETVAYPLLEQLEGFLVECYDGTTWVRTWDTELTRRLPKQVRVTISLQESGKTVSFQIVAVPRIESL